LQFEERIEINASQQSVFAIYANVARWANWDSNVQSSSISGVFESGATGRLKPSNGPAAKIVFVEVVPNESFTVEAKLPLCVMRFEHELSPIATGVRSVHRVTFSGILAPLFGRIIGGKIRQSLPRTMAGLKHAAESKPREQIRA
jgi:hypothetical protein